MEFIRVYARANKGPLMYYSTMVHSCNFTTRNSLHTRTANDLTNLNPFRHMVQHTNILKERTDLEPRFKKLQYEYGQHLVLVLSKVV